MKKDIVLKNREQIQKIQDILVSQADGVNIEGDGKHIVHSSNFP